ncbi:Major facilitator super domain-containing protein 7 [Physocladia obscura]|uniref:Major facilitator super domain-containing protein 7 n=1 Tax=Physocladia obscura TaxID=109957 RepID=A0AAD5TAW5_9FUNG|nr:Major facilitator super domain-containing protein 7 [Physocladia obscura]
MGVSRIEKFQQSATITDGPLLYSELALSPRRFWVAAGVFFANFNNAFVWATYSPVTGSAAAYYGCSEWTINLAALVFQITFLPFAYPAIWALDAWGLRISTLIGAWGITAGAFIRWIACFGPVNFRLPLLFAGQTIAAAATPFAFNTPTKVCAAWFGDKERLTANTIMSLSIYAGTAMAMGLSPAIVGSDPNNINTLNLVSFVIIFTTGMASLLVFDKPEFAPSKSAQEELLPFLAGLKSLTRNPQFYVIFVVYGVIFGALDTYFTLISDYVTPYGYSEADAGVLGINTIISGTISSLILGPILDRTKSHRFFFKALTFVTLIGAILFYFSAPYPARRILLQLSACVIGIGGFSLAPIALELGVECTFPVAEGASAGMLQTSGQIFGVIILLASNALRTSDGLLQHAMVWRIMVCAVVCLVVPFYTASSRRMELENAVINSIPLQATGNMDEIDISVDEAADFTGVASKIIII